MFSACTTVLRECARQGSGFYTCGFFGRQQSALAITSHHTCSNVDVAIARPLDEDRIVQDGVEFGCAIADPRLIAGDTQP